nr:immunoglobulin heavy chain junction region [Macaca mulatta]
CASGRRQLDCDYW